MSNTKIVANKTASAKAGHPVYYTKTSNVNNPWFRIQVQSVGYVIQNGFESKKTLTGFYYVGSEERAKEVISGAGVGLQLPGKVIYVDQLTPIMQESPMYGVMYPYPFRYNGTELTLEQRLAIQAAAAEKGVVLMQSGQAIYRKKVYTDDVNAVSSILSPDNLDDINAFIASVLEGAGSTSEAAKAARLAELGAIPSAKRTAEQKAELKELMA